MTDHNSATPSSTLATTVRPTRTSPSPDRLFLNQKLTSNLILTALFALLASFQFGFNLVSFSLLKNLVRRFAKSEACLTYLKASQHFRSVGIIDDIQIDADSIEMFGKRLNLSVICALKDNELIQSKMDIYMKDFLNFMCRVHLGIDNLMAIAELLFIIGAIIGSSKSIHLFFF